MSWNLDTWLGRLGVAVGLFVGAAPVQAGMADKYPPPWRDAAAPDITRALISGGARGCGEYVYRPRDGQRGEFLVYCTSNGRAWQAWLVWTGAGRVMGPYAIDAAVPPPR